MLQAARQSLIISGVVVLAGAFATAPVLRAQISEKGAAKDLKAGTKSELRDLKVTLGADHAALEQSLADLLAEVADGSVTPDVDLIDAVEETVGNHVAKLAASADAAVRSVEVLGSSLLAQLQTSSAEAFLIGGGGTLDRFVTNVDKLVARTRGRLLQSVNKLVKSVAKLAGGTRVHVWVAPIPGGSPPRPSAVASPASPAKRLRVGVLVAGSDRGVTDDGSLCAGGTADPSAGSVTVRIVAPDGASSQAIVTVDPVSCRWRSCFENLSEGNYLVVATQASGQTDSSGIGVP